MFGPAFSMAASKALPNFTPGKYKLTEGPADQCGEGTFRLRDNGKGVQFGAREGFNLHTTSQVLKSEIPEEEGCSYDVREKFDVLGDKTVISFLETLRCPDTIRHVLNRKATVTAGRVELDIDQKGNSDFETEGSFKHRCVYIKK
jgi:hypothetical protein